MPQILIVALNGSPNREGNTSYLIKQAVDECYKMGAKVETFHCQSLLKGLSTPFCVACSSPCSGKCYKDTELSKALHIISKADGIIVGNPVYFGTVSGQLKAFWDKTRKLRTEKSLLNVVGGVITSGASRFGGQEKAISSIHDIFLVQGMIIVGDGYHEDDCGHFGCASQKPSSEDTEAIYRAKILGKRITEVAKATKALRLR